jgi:hypothetical protein
MGLPLAHRLPGSQVDANAAGIKTILFLTVSALLVRYGQAPAGVNDPRSRTGPEQVAAEFGTSFPCLAPRPLRSMPECVFPWILPGSNTHGANGGPTTKMAEPTRSATGDRGAEEFPLPTLDIAAAAARPPCPAMETRGRVKLRLCFCALPSILGLLLVLAIAWHLAATTTPLCRPVPPRI